MVDVAYGIVVAPEPGNQPFALGDDLGASAQACSILVEHIACCEIIDGQVDNLALPPGGCGQPAFRG